MKFEINLPRYTWPYMIILGHKIINCIQRLTLVLYKVVTFVRTLNPDTADQPFS